ncbi:hypothetical protein J2858_001991 [Neorhizobium galegae]|uniref:hypothetical protein n=1 Tax=Neorhizobium galegae TaxID=399 RepID=UPI001AE60767|nr:hypothetical protein [Neorhizobium galegae]MBP2549075.1 hypothetical protein [Neorhizobium galegae]
MGEFFSEMPWMARTQPSVRGAFDVTPHIAEAGRSIAENAVYSLNNRKRHAPLNPVSRGFVRSGVIDRLFGVRA